ncbi:MAG: CinA family nicotinamide mononucleotide deamidase-related protein [Bacteroidales bacterium]|nr:CinA family nicotinamide mononucleotide deamidase-related protein [Bacteroidales bacterium]
MDVIIITIGDELLTGHTVDTNSAWMGINLNEKGFSIRKRISIRDNREDIIVAFDEALAEEDIVLVTGGLGPTSDDITKPVLCEYFNTELVLHEESLNLIKGFMKRRGYELIQTNYNQAMVPAACSVLLNKMGTAPGMWFEKNGKILVSMPGVPYEMEYLMNTEVIPRLLEKFKPRQVLHRWAITQGIAEAFLADRLKDFESKLPDYIRLAYLPSLGIIKLRLSVYEASQNEENILEEKYADLQELVSDKIIGTSNDSLSELVGKQLLKANKTLALAESCTGGYIAHVITQISGSSAYFNGGVVAYSNEAKIDVLGVNSETIEQFGAVSIATAKEMAEGVRKKIKSDFGIATTGIAGPTGGTAEKPVGTVCIAIASETGTWADKIVFSSDRTNNIIRSANTALGQLIRLINE